MPLDDGIEGKPTEGPRDRGTEGYVIEHEPTDEPTERLMLKRRDAAGLWDRRGVLFRSKGGCSKSADVTNGCRGSILGRLGVPER